MSVGGGIIRSMSGWHPIVATVELEPGVWVMRDQFRDYGRIELRRLPGGALRYKAFHDGVHIGWATTLKRACEGVHGAYLAAHGPDGGINGA